jgi:uncharacterized protein (TIGR02453 family)
MKATTSDTVGFIFKYLTDLKAHNNRTWFTENKSRFETAREYFEFIVSALIAGFSEIEDLEGVRAEDCIYRIYRDVRFSKDKTPYKTNMSAVIGQGGRKAAGRGYYIQLEPGGESMIAGGPYMPTTKELGEFRRKIAHYPDGLKRILASDSFVRNFGRLEGESVKTAPHGFPKDHPEIELLKHKQFMAIHPLSDETALSDDLLPHTIEVFTAMKPFLSWFYGDFPRPAHEDWPGHHGSPDDENPDDDDALSYR